PALRGSAQLDADRRPVVELSSDVERELALQPGVRAQADRGATLRETERELALVRGLAVPELQVGALVEELAVGVDRLDFDLATRGVGDDQVDADVRLEPDLDARGGPGHDLDLARVQADLVADAGGDAPAAGHHLGGEQDAVLRLHGDGAASLAVEGEPQAIELPRGNVGERDLDAPGAADAQLAHVGDGAGLDLVPLAHEQVLVLLADPDLVAAG